MAQKKNPAKKATQKRQPEKKIPEKTRIQQMVADIESLANQLRKRVSQVTTQAERYVNQVRKELGWKPAKGKKTTSKKAAAKTSRKAPA